MNNLSPEKALIFRIVHAKNVPWILNRGLYCRNSGIYDPNYVEIGDSDLITKRAHRVVPIPPGGTLSDYVPFYFTPYSPMLYKIKTGHGIKKISLSDIVIIASSLNLLVKNSIKFVFSDRHAYLAAATFFSDLNDLKKLDWTILQNRDFKRDLKDPGKIERYQAEALIHKHMPLNGIQGLVCYDEEQQKSLETELANLKISLKIVCKKGLYP